MPRGIMKRRSFGYHEYFNFMDEGSSNHSKNKGAVTHALSLAH
jgi:hypothetical protein